MTPEEKDQLRILKRINTDGGKALHHRDVCLSAPGITSRTISTSGRVYGGAPLTTDEEVWAVSSPRKLINGICDLHRTRAEKEEQQGKRKDCGVNGLEPRRERERERERKRGK